MESRRFSSFATIATIFVITKAKLFMPVVTLSTQDDAKLLQQLESGLKRSVSWNKCYLKAGSKERNPYF